MSNKPQRTYARLQIESLIGNAGSEITPNFGNLREKHLELQGMRLVERSIPADAKGWLLTEDEKSTMVLAVFSSLAKLVTAVNNGGQEATAPYIVAGAQRAVAYTLRMPQGTFAKALQVAIQAQSPKPD